MYVSKWRYVGKKVDPFYISKPWRRVRLYVLQRNMYWCQVCKRRFANTVHHKTARKERPDLALDPENLEAICAICHNQEHPEKGRSSKLDGSEKKNEGMRIVKV